MFQNIDNRTVYSYLRIITDLPINHFMDPSNKESYDEKPHEYDESGDETEDSSYVPLVSANRPTQDTELQQLKERLVYLERDNKMYMAKISELTELVSKQTSRLAMHDDSIFVGSVTATRQSDAGDNHHITDESPGTNTANTGTMGTLASTSRKVENNWTSRNTDTVRNWKNTMSKSGFIYDYVRDKYKRLLDDVLLAALIMSTISTIISGVSTALLAIGSYQWVTFGINIALLVLTGAVSVLTGAVRIFKWDEVVATISTYIEKLDFFYALTASELLLPDKLREDAVDFIKKNDDTFMELMKATPNIDSEEYKKAAVEYKQFVADEMNNFKCSQKYSRADNNIDIY